MDSQIKSSTITYLLIILCILILQCSTLIFASEQTNDDGNKTSSEKNLIFDPNIVSSHCLEAPPISSNYEPTGFEWRFQNDLIIYETSNNTPTSSTNNNSGKNNTNKLLFVAYDIFGFHPNTKQVVDQIAQLGHFRIVMPDFFRGGWPTNDYPPKNKTAFQEFVNTNGSWVNVSRDLKNLISFYKNGNGNNNNNSTKISSFGIFGFCWGGKVSVLASSEFDEISAAGLIHPSSVLTSDADSVKSPMYLLPSSTEPDMTPFYNKLVDKFGVQNVGHKRFDLPHGFAGARGNFEDSVNRQAVQDVIQILSNYFNQQLK